MPSPSPKHHKVVAVIVTYGNRSHFATATISGAFKCGVSKIILVQNGKTTPISEREIGDDQYRNIEFIQCEKNGGSAGGFNTGIQFATKDDKNDYVWLLDDDNLPHSDALERLIEWHEKLSKKTPGAARVSPSFHFAERENGSATSLVDCHSKLASHQIIHATASTSTSSKKFLKGTLLEGPTTQFLTHAYHTALTGASLPQENY